MKTTALLLFTLLSMALFAQQHNTSSGYVTPSDNLVKIKLDKWQDLKFGLLMHWGPYSQWGIVESWSICPEDEGWTERKGPYANNYFGYKSAYENLQTTFNPTQFDPEKWAEAAQYAGMKYVVFTTKHHDGFCMFDSKETDYKITSTKSPFVSHAKSNVTKEIFNAFRNKGFMIGAYFSKPDWHSENYWWPYFPPKDRNVNYDPKKYPDKWNAFKQFTYNQIKELSSEYGSVDILWLDGGWVRPLSSVDPSVDWQKSITHNQDIDMANIAKMARSYHPGMLVVDRTVAGEYENYVTPEQQVPNEPLDHPWESCLTMGGSWSYVPNDHYKSTTELVSLLVKIVSRGGNLLLNVGPSPQGDFADPAYSRLKEIGNWMKTNGEGIYNTVPVAPYSYDNIFLTQSKDGKTVYAFVLGDKTDQIILPTQIRLEGLALSGKKISASILGNSAKLKVKFADNRLVIDVPSSLQNKPIAKHAIAIKITQ
jgi:alpha-L-fucosidase